MVYKFYRLVDIIRYEIPNFIKNIWKFRKALLDYYWYDYKGLLMFIEITLRDKADKTEIKGYEIDESRLKKVEKMRRAAEIIRNCVDDNYLDLAEKQSGKKFIYYSLEFESVEDGRGYYKLKDSETPEEKETNSFLIKLSMKIEEEEWNELTEILRGQDYSKFDDKKDFYKQFDGTGLKTWWD